MAAARCGNHADVGSILDRFSVAHLAATKPTYLSPGEKQRVALARALASRPSLFLVDEPFAALDAATTFALRDELTSFLRETGLPAVFVTHGHAEARALADHVAIIEAGAIQQHGRAVEVFDHPATPAIARFLSIENVLAGRIAAIERERIRVSPTCAESGVWSRQINGLAKKSPLHFGSSWGSLGADREGRELVLGKAHALRQNDAEAIEQRRLGSVGLSDAAQADRTVGGGG